MSYAFNKYDDTLTITITILVEVSGVTVEKLSGYTKIEDNACTACVWNFTWYVTWISWMYVRSVSAELQHLKCKITYKNFLVVTQSLVLHFPLHSAWFPYWLLFLCYFNYLHFSHLTCCQFCTFTSLHFTFYTSPLNLAEVILLFCQNGWLDVWEELSWDHSVEKLY